MIPLANQYGKSNIEKMDSGKNQLSFLWYLCHFLELGVHPVIRLLGKWMIQKKTFNINRSQVQEIEMKPWSQQSGAFDSHYQEQVRRLRPAGCLSWSGLSLSPLAPQLWELSKKLRKSKYVTFVSSPALGRSWQWWRERCPTPGPRGSRGTWSRGSTRSRPRPCPRRPAAGSACTSTSTRGRCRVRMDG